MAGPGITSHSHRQPYSSSAFSVVLGRAGQEDGEKGAEMGMLLGLQSKPPEKAQLPAGPRFLSKSHLL